ncbi:hypothetical protein GGS20DRAFT_578675 [Poronia punctata]|nr:hypothetical protein GGS20DRAFT_578675 [Poronia punctata]
MPWAINPVFQNQTPEEVAPEPTPDLEAASRSSANDSTNPDPLPLEKQQEQQQGGDDEVSGFRQPTSKFTAHQIFYIFILDGIGAAILSGGINFAIAYALYHGRGGEDSPIRLFQFPNTLAGDTAVTIFIQFLITWIIESVLVNLDLKKGAVAPIGFIPEPRRKVLRWFMFLDRPRQSCDVRSIKHWLEFLLSQAIRSLILAAAFFPVLWGASVGFLVLVGKHRADDDWDWYYSATWAPEIFKLVQGAILGLLFTPPMVMFWLCRCGWALKKKNEEPHQTPEIT